MAYGQSVQRRTVLAMAILLVFGGAIVAGWILFRQAHSTVTDNASAPAVQQTGLIQSGYQPPSGEGYAGTAACAECHGDIYKSFQTHPMSRSIARIDPDSDEVAAPADRRRVVGKQRQFEVELREGVMLHHETMHDDDGNLIYDQAVPMDYVVGSGRRAKAYLHQRDSLLFMSPLNWYARSAKWDLAPNYVADDPRRFERRVNEECLNCHAGRVAPLGRSLNRYGSRAFHQMAIGCENCHGPGMAHIAFHQSESRERPVADPIVNPARLDAARREAVCNQCHLQAAVRVLRPGRSDFDFRPGLRLEDVWTVLDTDLGVTDDGRTRAVNHVQQMRASRCFQQSAGRLGCSSCHDPHRLPADTERPAFYREKCFRCHDDASCAELQSVRAEKADSCIACHMPARDAKNISHVSQTDHRVLRRPAKAREGTGRGTSDQLAFLPGADVGLSSWERERALGLGAWMYLSKAGRRPSRDLEEFLARLLDQSPHDAALLLALGNIAHEQGDLARARTHYERARLVPAAEEEALSALLTIDYLASDEQAALQHADRLLAIDAGNARAHALRAEILTRAGKRSEGIAAARRALDSNPTLLEVRQWFVEALRAAGEMQAANEQEQILRRMRDAHPPSRVQPGTEDHEGNEGSR